MRRPLIPIALFFCGCLAAGASASQPKPEDHAPGTAVEMPYLIAPLSQDGKLIAYAYISSRVVASSPSAAITVRDKTPFIQDAYVRDVNSLSISDPNDPLHIDTNALARRLLALSRKSVGGATVSSVEIIRIQLSQIRLPGGH